MSNAAVPTTRVDQLEVRVLPDRPTMGRVAAEDAVAELRRLLASQDEVRVVFAAAPSQSEFLEALVAASDIDWGRVVAFHMDEYVGLPVGAPERFGQWLARHVFDRVPFKKVHVLGAGEIDDAGATLVADDYAAALAEAPIDIVFMGIGVNGHIAFNDPPVADFDDPHAVKVVELDQICRQQQVDDDCFATLDDVPTHALTLTVPQLMRADRLFCIVPASAKAAAVARTLAGPIEESCPATALRRHPNVTLYLDPDSAAQAVADGTIAA